ncbi:MAG: dihydrodipicolinate synthase family protein [Actinomycetaceae bacterium]|nr:dihydrodipicolinate synthase family protein [Actinomycetaceae bacterium]MDY6082543.1 dihydrodipicolinate synthase family protein [Actinomycetaceae bacterium]
MTSKFSGVIPPVVVARHEDRSLDLPSYQRNLERLIGAGVHGLFILGSSGEGAFLTMKQREAILRTTMETVDGRLPVLAGVIDTQTDRVLEMVKQAEDFGVDAIVSTAPFYALGGMAQVERHFRVLREHTELPIFGYDIPVCTHIKFSNQMSMRLGEEGVLNGIKDSSGDDVGFRYLCLLNREAGHPLQLFTGHEVVVDGAYMSGADGSVPGLGNVDPFTYVEQWNAFQAGDWEKVRSLQDQLADLMTITSVPYSILGMGAGVGAFKVALKLLGVFESDTIGEPVARLQPDEVESIRKILVRHGLVDETAV